MDKIKIIIKDDYSSTPGPRYITEGDFSGEDFRKKLLYPKFIEAKENNTKLFIDLDGTAGYGTSFLEEAFGGLVRIEKCSADEVKNILEFKTDEEDYLENDIIEYINEANQSI